MNISFVPDGGAYEGSHGGPVRGSRPGGLGGEMKVQSGWPSGPSLGLLLETQSRTLEDVGGIVQPLVHHQTHLTKSHRDPIVQS